MMDIFQDNDRPDNALTATLHYLAIETSDPETLGRFYADTLGYTVTTDKDSVAAAAPQRKLKFLTGEPKRLREAGFLLPDAGELARLRHRIAGTGWACKDGPTEDFEDAVHVRDPDGTSLTFGIVASVGRSAGGSNELAARLQHVVMASRNPARVASFLVDVLGFTVSDEVRSDTGELTTSFLRCSAEHHSFAVFKAGEDRFDHHCYETQDWNMIRDWADHLATRHVKLQWGPGRHGPGNNLFIFLHDPDGNWVELSAELEQVAHDRPPGEWRHEERTLNSWGQGKLRI